MDNNTNKTPFYNQHVTNKGKMVPFAGVSMPLHYEMGIIKEHEWVRTRAGIFDVSHMGQAVIKGADAAKVMSYLTPSDFEKIALWQCKYTVLTNENGGIKDDFIAIRTGEDSFHLVFNASMYEADLKWVQNHLTGDASITPLSPQSPLIALQGPYAEEVLAELMPNNVDISALGFMRGIETRLMGADVLITRTGYTGEDGFELSVSADSTTANHIWLALAQHEAVKPIGLGARDSLRLEAGFPLYGNDLTEDTTPIQAGLGWVVSKNHSGFMGEETIRAHQQDGVERKRFGVLITEKGVAREGTKLFSPDGHEIGVLTSGGFSPSTKQSIGHGYLDVAYCAADKIILAEVRNRRLRARTHELNFINQRDFKPSA